MSKSLENHISIYFQEKEKLIRQELIELIKKDFRDWSDNTINMYLSRLKKEGIVNTPSRGIYQLGSKKPFKPDLSNNVKRMFKKIQKEFPFIAFCIWDSVWLNDFMRHQPFKRYIVIEVEKEAAEPVFAFLAATIKNVFFNPNEEIFNRYISNVDEVVIVKNMVSEAPLMEEQKTVVPELEKLLVDMLIDTALFSAQQSEIEFIMKSANNKFSINKLKMRRYAIRRNREKELSNLIDISLA